MSSDSVPSLVERAAKLARVSGFGRSCLPEVERLLQVLTGTVREGMIGEIGTDCGVGAAWIAEGLSSSSRFVAVEEEVKGVCSSAERRDPRDTGGWQRMNLRGGDA